MAAIVNDERKMLRRFITDESDSKSKSKSENQYKNENGDHDGQRKSFLLRAASKATDPNLIDGEQIKQHVTISRCRLDEERRLVKNNNVHNALLKLQSENEMRSSSSLNINNLMSKSNNTNCSNDNSTITSSSSVNISNNSRNTTTTSTINSGNSNCNNTQNININVQDMGLFPRYDRNRPLQAYQDLFFPSKYVSECSSAAISRHG